MLKRHGLAIMLGLFLSLSLIGGSLTHALVQHEHSDHHHAGESVIWQSLHNALLHEKKWVVPAVVSLSVLAVLISVSHTPTRRAFTVVDSRIEYLRRGIAPHRVFG